MSKPAQVTVRRPSKASRLSSQSEFLKIRVDLYTLQQVLFFACCDLGSPPKDDQDKVEGFQYLSGV